MLSTILSRIKDSLNDIKKSLNKNKLIVEIAKENKDKFAQNVEKIKNRLYLEYRSMGYDLNEFELTNKSLSLLGKYGVDSIDDENLLHDFVYQDCESRLLEKKEDPYLEKLEVLSMNSYKKYHELEKLEDSLMKEKSIINKKLNDIKLIENEKNISILKKISLDQDKRSLINRLNEIRREFEEVQIDMASTKFK